MTTSSLYNRIRAFARRPVAVSPPPPAAPPGSPVAGSSVVRMQALGQLWQDAGKTVAAAADTDPVRVATDDAGVDWTAPSDAARPLLRTDGTHWWLESDGVDDYLLPAANPLTGSPSGYVVWRLRHLAGAGGIHTFTTGSGTNHTPYLDGNVYESFGASARSNFATAGAFDSDVTYEARADASGVWQTYMNGTLENDLTGNTVTFDGDGRILFGDATANYPWNGRLYGFALYATAPDQAAARSWAGGL